MTERVLIDVNDFIVPQQAQWPSAFLARSVTTCSPAFFNFPVIWPVFLSSFKPRGSPFAEKVIGRSPVAVMVN
jgi:hypothetical protein